MGIGGNNKVEVRGIIMPVTVGVILIIWLLFNWFIIWEHRHYVGGDDCNPGYNC